MHPGCTCKNTDDDSQVQHHNLTLMPHVMYKVDTFTAQSACKALMSKSLQEETQVGLHKSVAHL